MRKILLLLTACNGWGDTLDPVNRVKGVDDAVWHSEVSQASNSWRDMMKDGCYPFHIARDGECGNHITLIPQDDWDHGDDVGGIEYTFGGYIEIVGDSPYYRQPILMHEIGHAMGLEHDSNPLSIMYPTILGDTQPSPNDIRNAERVMGCL